MPNSSTQWKKGQSGNPLKGRPPARESAAEISHALGLRRNKRGHLEELYRRAYGLGQYKDLDENLKQRALETLCAYSHGKPAIQVEHHESNEVTIKVVYVSIQNNRVEVTASPFGATASPDRSAPLQLSGGGPAVG